MKKTILAAMLLAFLAVPSGRATAQDKKITAAELLVDFQSLATKIENSELNKAGRDNLVGLMGYLSRTIPFKPVERRLPPTSSPGK